MNKLGKFQIVIMHLLHEDDYIGVDQVIEHLGLQRTRSNLVSVRRAFHLLQKRGMLNVAKFDYDDGRAWGLIAWLPGTSPPSIAEEIKVANIENVVLNFLNYLKQEFSCSSGVDYRLILGYIKKINSKIGNIQENDARVPVAYHRALKSLVRKNSIVLDFTTDNGRIETIALNSSNNI